ncbi:DNA-directed RNA polymerase III subunit RPC5 [Irineochytrium annulatum]|nr:DNA-directed RNA polymerase III subunit RPC5 [Irineochytrium annulatum]
MDDDDKGLFSDSEGEEVKDDVMGDAATAEAKWEKGMGKARGANAANGKGPSAMSVDGDGAGDRGAENGGGSPMQVDGGEGAEEDGDGADEGDDDAVVLSIPVFLSQQLKDKLVLFQYPTRTTAFPAPVVSRYKPKSQRFEFDVPLDTGSKYYGEVKGQEFGRGLDDEAIQTALDYASEGRKKKNQAPKEDKILDKMTLTSSLVPLTSTYLVGTVRDGELHLAPVSAAVQIRPTLKYLDKISEKERSMQQRLKDAEDGLERKEEEKVIQARVVQNDDKEAIQRRAQGLLEAEYEKEEWQELKLVPEDAPESEELFERLISIGDDVDISIQPSDFLDTIIPKPTPVLETTSNKRKVKSKEAAEQVDRLANLKPGTPLNDLLALPAEALPHKIKGLLMNAHVVPFFRVQEIFPTTPPEDLIRELERLAVLVRGVWIVRSEILYTKRECEARRYILSLFNSGEVVTRRGFNIHANLPYAQCTNMIAEIAWLEKGKGWRLKCKPDKVFCDAWPDVVKRQKDVVTSEGTNAKLIMTGRAKAATTVGAAPAGAAKKKAAPASITALGAVSSSSASLVAGAASGIVERYPLKGTTQDAQLENLIRAMLTEHGVCSGQYMVLTCMCYAGLEKEGNKLFGLSEGVVSGKIEQMCAFLHERYALKTLNNSGLDMHETFSMFLPS